MEDKPVLINWTPFALEKLDEIYEYLVFKTKSIEVGLKFTDRIFAKTDQLGNFPESGQLEPYLKAIGQESRYLVEGNYKIIYEYRPIYNLIIITDIFNTSQYPEKIRRGKR